MNKTEPFIHIRKNPSWAYMYSPTWAARCTLCKTQWGYYHFGATLGSVQEHIRKRHYE